jgi:hypothetical protein
VSDTLACTDLYKTAFLMLRGHRVTTTRLPSGRTRFDFPAAAADDACAFEQGAGVSATLYADMLRRVKKMLAASPTHFPIEVDTNARSSRSAA